MPKFTVKENTEYTHNTATHYIEFVDGEFQGLAFVFGAIEFKGENKQGEGKLNFDYNLLNVVDGIDVEKQRKSLDVHVGDVLKRILEEQVLNNTPEVIDETGNPDTEQSDS